MTPCVLRHPAPSEPRSSTCCRASVGTTSRRSGHSWSRPWPNPTALRISWHPRWQTWDGSRSSAAISRSRRVMPDVRSSSRGPPAIPARDRSRSSPPPTPNSCSASMHRRSWPKPRNSRIHRPTGRCSRTCSPTRSIPWVPSACGRETSRAAGRSWSARTPTWWSGVDTSCCGRCSSTCRSWRPAPERSLVVWPTPRSCSRRWQKPGTTRPGSWDCGLDRWPKRISAWWRRRGPMPPKGSTWRNATATSST